MKKYIAGLSLLISLLLMPVFVFAQSPAGGNSIPPYSCVPITHDLTWHSRDISTGGDVSALQVFLLIKGYLDHSPTGYFGPLTQTAVKAFQTANNIPSDGTVGLTTRTKINAVCGTETTVTNDDHSITITSVGSPANNNFQFYPGDHVTVVGKNFPANPTISFGSANTTITGQTNSSGQNINFIAPDLEAGVYNLTVGYSLSTAGPSVRSNVVQVTILSHTPPPTNSTYSPITITSPNGGESWSSGSNQTITWTGGQKSDGTYSGVDISLIPQYCPPNTTSCIPTTEAYHTITTAALRATSYSWNVGHAVSPNYTNGYSVAPGNYYIKVCVTGTKTCGISNNYFKIVNPTQPSLTITSPAGGENYTPGQQISIKYIANNFHLNNIAIQLNKGATYATGSYTLPVTQTSYSPASGSYLFTLPTNLVSGNDYSFQILTDYTTNDIGYYGHSNNFSVSASTGSTGTPTPTPTPTATSSQSIVSFSLMNADTSNSISVIENGSTINLHNLPTQHLGVRANASPANVGSVKIQMVDSAGTVVSSRVEGGYPYSVFGDNNGVYVPWTPAVGTYTVVATPYTGANASGTPGKSLTITFKVVNTTTTAALYDLSDQFANVLNALNALVGQ